THGPRDLVGVDAHSRRAHAVKAFRLLEESDLTTITHVVDELNGHRARRGNVNGRPRNDIGKLRAGWPGSTEVYRLHHDLTMLVAGREGISRSVQGLIRTYGQFTSTPRPRRHLTRTGGV